MEKTISENLFADYTRNGVLTLFMDNLDTVRTLAPDLRTGYPRSPRETLAGYVLAARIVDKGRAALVGQLGEYHYGRNPSLDTVFFDFTGLTPEVLQAFLATGADDTAVADWIQTNARPQPRIDIIKWNNRLRDLRPSEAPDHAQEYMEDYIPAHLPKNRPVYVWFDIYDIEEGRL
jgi:hypothetical protein